MAKKYPLLEKEEYLLFLYLMLSSMLFRSALSMFFSRVTPSGLDDLGRIFPRFRFSFEDLFAEEIKPAPPVIVN